MTGGEHGRDRAERIVRLYLEEQGIDYRSAVAEAIEAYWLPLACIGRRGYSRRERSRVGRTGVATLEARANRLRELYGLEGEREAGRKTLARLLAAQLRQRSARMRASGLYLPDNWLHDIERIAGELECAGALLGTGE